MNEPVTMLLGMLRGKTQKILAKQLGISPQYLHDILARRRRPGKKILNALGLELVISYRTIKAHSAKRY